MKYKVTNESINNQQINTVDNANSSNTKQKFCQLISDNLGEMLNKQKNEELYNHNLYKTFANFYKEHGLLRLSEYWYERGQEEFNHYDWIQNRLNECNYDHIMSEIPEIKHEWDQNDLVKPFELSVIVEKETTKNISNIYKAAFDEGDYKIVQWLADELIEEQHEEEVISTLTYMIAKDPSDNWFSKSDLIYNIYKEKKYVR